MDLLGDEPLEDRTNDRATEHTNDPIDAHPDLRALGNRLRLEMDETLRAEQYAARVSAQRRGTMRDRFLMAEDRGERINIEVVDGSDICGLVVAVGVDHVVVIDGDRYCWVALAHIIAVRMPT